MGSDKIYSTTLNGFLIVSSSHKLVNQNILKKLEDQIYHLLVINNGRLYILTDESKILVLN